MKEFPPFRLDTANQCLWRGAETREDERILLTPKAFGVLRYLVEHAGRLVTHNELLDAVWPATHVQPQATKKLILDLRTALGDPAQKPLFIETLHRRGYRFIAPVREVGEKQSSCPAPAAPRKLVGREGQLAELRECLGTALKGERQFAFIVGEPGIGKTALADEFQRRASVEVPEIRVARGQCIEGYGGQEAYYPMLEAVGHLCRGAGGESVIKTLATQAPTWLVQFPALVNREHRELLQRELLGATRERMVREIADALETIASTTSLLLVLEDLQWVDYATSALLSALARRRGAAKLMLIGTKRPLDMVQPEHPFRALKDELLAHELCREIALQPLEEAEIAEYLIAEAPDARLPEGLARLVYHHSDGNPLFMVAALEHLIERGLISRGRGAWRLRVPLQEISLEVPHKLRRMIEAQIARLTAEEQRMLEVASVEGVAFSTAVCAPVANLDREVFEEHCERLSGRHHIVRPLVPQQFSGAAVSSRYQFVHALYRETCYRRQAPGRRATIHQRIGERLEVLLGERLGDVAPDLAYHFEASSDAARAVTYLRAAAEVARRRFANREATAILRHALELCTKLARPERALNEIEILESLGMIYAGDYDIRASESFEAMASRAAHCELIDVEARALIGLAYPLSWTSSARCLEVLERALVLSDRQTDSLVRAISRMSCYFYRIWVGGWNARDAEECQNALAEIRELGDVAIRSYHLAQYSLLQWASSKYREADLNLSEAVSNLLGSHESSHLNLSLIYWVHLLFSSSSLLFLGEWGKAFNQFRTGIAMLDKNGDEYRANTLRLYLAWASLQAMDFEGALKICESAFSHPDESAVGTPPDSSTPLPEEARICLILNGSAHLGLGNFDRALEHLFAVRNAMDKEMVIIDWYWRMPLESGLTELWLAKGDVAKARAQAERFLNATLLTEERTWQALAWEANARVSMAERNFERAQDCITKALSTIGGFEVPLADWRVHATAAQLYERTGDRNLARQHSASSAATILRLANSLESGDPLQKIFLSAPPVRNILEGAQRSKGGPQRSRSNPGPRLPKVARRSSGPL